MKSHGDEGNSDQENLTGILVAVSQVETNGENHIRHHIADFFRLFFSEIEHFFI